MDSYARMREALIECGRRLEKSDDRVTELESKLAAERVLHGTGKCTCHLEGTCIWCRWVAAQTRVEEIEGTWRNNYGNATNLHLDMGDILGRPEQSGEGE